MSLPPNPSLVLGQRPLRVLHRESRVPANTRRLGPYQIEDLITASEEGAGTVYRVEIPADTTTGASVHRLAEEFYYVLSGKGTVVVDGLAQSVSAGHFLRLPPGAVHQFKTTDEALEMLNIHTPGCRPDRDTYFVSEAPEGFGPGQGP